jgi:monovalent cation:H+ antiporter, CPA1 family
LTLVALTILILCACLVAVALAEPIAQRLGLPPPVVLAVFGLAAGIANILIGPRALGIGLDDYDRWLLGNFAFDSQTLLLVFLPPLLFEMSLGVDARRALNDSAAIAALAIVAVLVATLTVGFALKMTSDLTLSACLLLGAAVSTTDPSAVVSTFRRIGAPRRLTTLLEGESLLNDAAAIALFGLFLASLNLKAEQDLVRVGLVFAQSLSVGALAGIACAFFASWVFSLLNRSAVAEGSITVALAYGSYLVAERLLGASGVVAVVFSGITTAWVGQLRMGPKNWSRVVAVWSQIGFWASSLVLIVAAISAPSMLRALSLGQIALLLVVYIAAFAARLIILGGGLPILEALRFSSPIGVRQKALIWWGGVRGAVTLVLAMSLNEITALGNDARVVAALGAGFALMTLLINASTLGLVTRRLGLDRLSEADRALREQILSGVQRDVGANLADIAVRRGIGPEIVESAAAVIQARMGHAETIDEILRIPFGERLRLGLTVLAAQERRLVQSGFEGGTIGPRSARILFLNADRLADGARLRGRSGYKDVMLAAAHYGQSLVFAGRLFRWTGWDLPLRHLLARHLLVLLETEAIQHDLASFAGTSLKRMIGDDAFANLDGLILERMRRIADHIAAIRLQYPVYVATIERILLLRAAFREEAARFQALETEGIIGPELARNLAVSIEKRRKELEKTPELDLRLAASDLVRTVPLFRALQPEQQRTIAKALRTRFATPGEVLVSKGERGNAMFFIASGVLEVRGLANPVRLANGDFFGELAVLVPGRKRGTDVVSLGFARLLMLRRREFRKIAERSPEIGQAMHDAATLQLGAGFRNRAEESMDWSATGQGTPPAATDEHTREA